VKIDSDKLDGPAAPGEGGIGRPVFASTVLDAVEALVVVLNPEGRIVRFNPACERATQYLAGEVLDRPLWDLFLAPEEAMAARRVFGRLRAGQFPLRYENDWIAKDGTCRRILWSNSCLVDDTGEVSFVVGTGVDITERERAQDETRSLLDAVQEKKDRVSEKMLGESEARYQTILRAAMHGFWVADTQGVLLEVNDAYCRMSGYSEQELLAMRISDLETAETVKTTAAHIQKTMVQGEDRFESRHRHKDGSILEVEVNVQYRPAEGGRLVCFLQDITDRKRAENSIRVLNATLERRVDERTAALEEVNRGLESFSYSVSHDLRAPLRAIGGFSNALEEDCGKGLSEEGKGYLDRIGKAVQRMEHLIDGLLQLSRISTGALSLASVDLSAMASKALDDLRRGDPQRVATIDVQPGLVARVDPRIFEPALTNLLGNAWKFTAYADQARMGFSREESPDGTTTFCVRDNGAGFDMAYTGKLFGAFQRLHSPQQFEGTGIGLAIVQRIIHRHGGRVWAEGAVGKGAAFFFTLPDPAPAPDIIS